MTHAARPFWPLFAALAAGVLGVSEWCAGRQPPATRAQPPAGPVAAPGVAVATPSVPPCPAEHLLDEGVCVPLPPPAERDPEAAAQIDLLPGRPADYARYLTPIAGSSAVRSKDGLGAFVAAPRGTPAMALALEGQVGPAARLQAGSPPRLLTLHHVERAGARRSYVLVYDGLALESSASPSELAVGTPLGRVAAGPAPTGLGIEVRQVRRGIELGPNDGDRALLDSVSLRCDARNVLPFEPPPTGAQPPR